MVTLAAKLLESVKENKTVSNKYSMITRRLNEFTKVMGPEEFWGEVVATFGLSKEQQKELIQKTVGKAMRILDKLSKSGMELDLRSLKKITSNEMEQYLLGFDGGEEFLDFYDRVRG